MKKQFNEKQFNGHEIDIIINALRLARNTKYTEGMICKDATRIETILAELNEIADTLNRANEVKIELLEENIKLLKR